MWYGETDAFAKIEGTESWAVAKVTQVLKLPARGNVIAYQTYF